MAQTVLGDVLPNGQAPEPVAFKGIQIVETLQESHLVQSAPPSDLFDDQKVEKSLADDDG
jgi:hypothetical protein